MSGVNKKRLVVAMSGASGSIYAVRLLTHLKQRPDIETHLVISSGALRTLSAETDFNAQYLYDLADAVHNYENVGASIASGSFQTAGMVVLPCSVRTLSGIANSFNDNLITRAADVTLKERRALVLLFRETPLHLGHIRLMQQVTEMGAIVLPASPGFYHRPTTIEALVDHLLQRVLDLLRLEGNDPLATRWQGVLN